MKSFPLYVLICAAGLYAQTPPAAPPPPTPPAAEPAPDKVIASFEGKKLTFGELKSFLMALPPQQQQMAMNNPKMLVHQYFLYRHLADQALKEKLDQQSPTKEQLEYWRTTVLAQAKLNDVVRNMSVDDEDLKKYYEANLDKYTQVKVKVLYVSFSSNPAESGANGKKLLSEDEAKAKIAKVLAEIRGGADFVQMVKKYSEDTTSADKEGDFGTIRKSDNVPDAIRTAVFSLKAGEVSEPVRQPNGFYLFRAEEIGTRTFQQVQMDIYEQARQAKSQAWMAKLNESINFKVEDEKFFTPPAPAAAAPAGPALPVK
jgi:peptidyl-prolyl cis-trans isomerase C